ncbi:hypothetical protein Tco_1418993 [Tanacetum coccineum]
MKDDKETDEVEEVEEVEEVDEAELKKHLVIVKDDDIAIDAIPLATKPPVIVEYKLLKEGIMVHYQLIRANGSSKRYTSMIRMLQGIDREDLQTLWKLVKIKHGDTRPEDEHERVLWGDLKVMFEPNIKSDVWRNLQGYKVTIWKLFDSCGVHFVRFENVHIFMLVEKRYPLTPITITNMLNKKLQTDYWNEMCYQLLKLMIQKMNIKFRGGLLGLKRLQGFLELLLLSTAGTKSLCCWITTARRLTTVKRIKTCTKPKRHRNSTWFKEKAMLTEIMESGMEIPTLAAFQTDDLDPFDSDYDETPFASAVLIAKLSSYDSEVLLEVPIHDNYLDNHVIGQNVQEMQYSEQPVFNNETNIDITSDSNMISYEQYLKETKNAVVQDTSSSAQQDAMIMSMIKEMSKQVAKCNEVDKVNKAVNESLTTELEKYKEQIKLFEERQNCDLNNREKYLDSQLREPHDALRVMDTEETLEMAEEISLVKDSFNKMRSHVNDFQNVVTIRTKVTGQNNGSWGFEHIREAFDKDVKPFVKTLKEYFHMFDQGKLFEIKDKELIIENDRLLEHIICQDVMSVVMHADVESKNVLPANNNSLEHDNLEAELLKKENDRLIELIISQDLIENQCISLEIKMQQYKESFQNNQLRNNQTVPEFLALFKINDLKAQLEVKNNSISKLKDHIATLKGNCVSEDDKFANISRVVAPRMYKLDLEPLSPKLLRNREAHVVQIILWYLDSGCSKHMTRQRSQLINFVRKFMGTVRFENDHVVAIKGYRDYHIGNVMISWVYYVEG